MSTLFLYIVIGFLAQMIDGSLGMAYGVSCRTFLRSAARLPAPVVSAVIHCAEIPASLASGIAHARIGNVDRRLLTRLLIPGVIGGILGAWLLSGAGDVLEPVIDVYLIIMGAVIIFRARRDQKSKDLCPGAWIAPLGLAGGFFDAAGGGGWGPIVTSTVAASGNDIKRTIGTVNAAEFLVTVAETTTFAFFLRGFREHLVIILGLIAGGVAAAPLAARVCKKIPARPLMVLVGILIISLNIYNLVSLFV